MDNNFIFDFEKLTVYQVAIDFTDQVFNIASQYGRNHQFSIGDQFRRAALSICNNIAEGSGKSGRSKLQFYHYALDSARECVPMITISLRQRQIQTKEHDRLRSECVQITRMLYRLIDSVRT